MSTGALARWTRACATHPWRVVFAFIGILVLLVGSVGAFGGELRDEFEIPGSETQNATDLIEAPHDGETRPTFDVEAPAEALGRS